MAPYRTGIRRSRPSLESRRSETFRNVSLGIAGIVSSVMIPLLGLYYTSRDKQREVSQGFVEIATKILADKPTNENKPLREWAVNVLDSYSDIKLPQQARNSLLNNQPIFASAGVAPVSAQRLTELQTTGITLGISLSQYNREVDFRALASRGIQFVFIRATQGTSRIDSKALDYAKAARANGIRVAFYHFFVPNADPAAQLGHFAKFLAGAQWDLPPAIDCGPFPGAEMPPDYAGRVGGMAAGLARRFGTKPIIYTQLAFANDHMSREQGAYPLFVADFAASKKDAPRLPKWWSNYTFWHLADAVSDDPVIRQYDIVGFNGPATRLPKAKGAAS